MGGVQGAVPLGQFCGARLEQSDGGQRINIGAHGRRGDGAGGGCDQLDGQGCCDTSEEDFGMHTVCARMTSTFLEFSKSQGNDLSTPRPEFGFDGLQPGDRWCLCAARWQEAYEAGMAPEVFLESTHQATLKIVELNNLQKHAVDVN